jgi:hypothetical protein
VKNLIYINAPPEYYEVLHDGPLIIRIVVHSQGIPFPETVTFDSLTESVQFQILTAITNEQED